MGLLEEGTTIEEQPEENAAVETAPAQNQPAAQEPAQDPAQGGDKLEETDRVVKMGVDILYGQIFEQMIAMFKKNGAEGFPKAMSLAINKVLDEVEKQGRISPEVAAAAGMKLFFMLLEDIIRGGVIPKVDTDVITKALEETIQLYGKSHGVPQEEMSQLMQQLAQKAQGGGA